MNSDDEKRLAEIRDRANQWKLHYLEVWGPYADREWLLTHVDGLRAKLDESERARKGAEAAFEAEHALVFRNIERREKAEAALAEERAKREAAEIQYLLGQSDDVVKLLARAEAAEARVRGLEAELRDANRNEAHLEAQIQELEREIREMVGT